SFSGDITMSGAGTGLAITNNETVGGTLTVTGLATANGGLTVGQPTAATSGANQSSSSLNLSGNYWNGSASATDSFTMQDVLGGGTNPSETLTFDHTGS